MVHIYSNPACLTLPIDHVTSVNSLPCQYVKKKKSKYRIFCDAWCMAWQVIGSIVLLVMAGIGKCVHQIIVQLRMEIFDYRNMGILSRD